MVLLVLVLLCVVFRLFSSWFYDVVTVCANKCVYMLLKRVPLCDLPNSVVAFIFTVPTVPDYS